MTDEEIRECTNIDLLAIECDRLRDEVCAAQSRGDLGVARSLAVSQLKVRNRAAELASRTER